MERSTLYLRFDHRYILYFPSFFHFRIHFPFYGIEQIYASFNLSKFSKSLSTFLKKEKKNYPLSCHSIEWKILLRIWKKRRKEKYISTSPQLRFERNLGSQVTGVSRTSKTPAKFRDEPVGNLKLSVPSFPIRRSSPSRSIVPPRKTITVHEKGGFKACDDIPYAGLVVIIQA